MMGGRYEKYVLMPSRLASLVANAVSYFARPARNTLLLDIFRHPTGYIQTILPSYKLIFTLLLNADG